MLIVLCFAFSFPAAAAKISPVSGVIIMEPDSFGMIRSESSDGPIFRFQDEVPSTFEFSNDSYLFTWRDAMALLYMHSTYTAGNMEFSVIVNLGDGNDDLLVSFDSFSAQPFYSTTFANGVSQSAYFSYTGTLELYVDGNRVYSEDLEHALNPSIPAWQGTVRRYIEYRITTSSPSEHVYNWEDPSRSYECLVVFLPNLIVNNVATIVEDISLSVSKIENDIGDINDGIYDLNNTLDDVSATVTNIEEGVVDIKSEITDMHSELSDSDSNIWQSGATVIKDSVTELFVPSEDDLQLMTDIAMITLMEKAGDAYVLMETGVYGGTTIVEAFHGGGRDSGVEFPGIMVSLPNIGTYTIIPPMQVNSVFLTDVFIIFQDALGVMICILCGLSIIHMCEDFFICLISGVSYWGFLRSRHR